MNKLALEYENDFTAWLARRLGCIAIKLSDFRHSHVSGNLDFFRSLWIPAFAGMTLT